VSKSDKLKDEAEQQAQEHPQGVSEGEKKLGMDSRQDETSQHDQNSAPQGTDKVDHRQGS
jgi:hypothetical protein